LNQLQIGFAGVLRRVFAKSHRAFLTAELNLATVEVDGLVGLGGPTRDGALQSRSVGSTQRVGSYQSHDSKRCKTKARFHSGPFRKNVQNRAVHSLACNYPRCELLPATNR